MTGDATDLALLALVMDDPRDCRVLAAWVGLGLRTDADFGEAAARIAAVCGLSTSAIEISLERLRTARLLADGGTTEVGMRWLHSQVSARLAKKGGVRR